MFSKDPFLTNSHSVPCSHHDTCSHVLTFERRIKGLIAVLQGQGPQNNKPLSPKDLNDYFMELIKKISEYQILLEGNKSKNMSEEKRTDAYHLIVSVGCEALQIQINPQLLLILESIFKLPITKQDRRFKEVEEQLLSLQKTRLQERFNNYEKAVKLLLANLPELSLDSPYNESAVDGILQALDLLDCSLPASDLFTAVSEKIVPDLVLELSQLNSILTRVASYHFIDYLNKGRDRLNLVVQARIALLLARWRDDYGRTTGNQPKREEAVKLYKLSISLFKQLLSQKKQDNILTVSDYQQCVSKKSIAKIYSKILKHNLLQPEDNNEKILGMLSKQMIETGSEIQVLPPEMQARFCEYHNQLNVLIAQFDNENRKDQDTLKTTLAAAQKNMVSAQFSKETCLVYLEIIQKCHDNLPETSAYQLAYHSSPQDLTMIMKALAALDKAFYSEEVFAVISKKIIPDMTFLDYALLLDRLKSDYDFPSSLKVLSLEEQARLLLLLGNHQAYQLSIGLKPKADYYGQAIGLLRELIEHSFSSPDVPQCQAKLACAYLNRGLLEFNLGNLEEMPQREIHYKAASANFEDIINGGLLLSVTNNILMEAHSYLGYVLFCQYGLPEMGVVKIKNSLLDEKKKTKGHSRLSSPPQLDKPAAYSRFWSKSAYQSQVQPVHSLLEEKKGKKVNKSVDEEELMAFQTTSDLSSEEQEQLGPALLPLTASDTTSGPAQDGPLLKGDALKCVLHEIIANYVKAIAKAAKMTTGYELRIVSEEEWENDRKRKWGGNLGKPNLPLLIIKPKGYMLRGNKDGKLIWNNLNRSESETVSKYLLQQSLPNKNLIVLHNQDILFNLFKKYHTINLRGISIYEAQTMPGLSKRKIITPFNVAIKSMARDEVWCLVQKTALLLPADEQKQILGCCLSNDTSLGSYFKDSKETVDKIVSQLNYLSKHESIKNPDGIGPGFSLSNLFKPSHKVETLAGLEKNTTITSTSATPKLSLNDTRV